MARLTKKQKSEILKIVGRWAHTIAGTRAPNMERVRELLAVAYKSRTVSRRVQVGKGKRQRSDWKEFRLDPPKIVIVESPMAFRIAQAVLRGRFSKKAATAAAKAFGIDPTFVNSLQRDVMIRFGVHNSWRRDNSAFYETWHDTIMPHLMAVRDYVFLEQDREDNSRRRAETRKIVERWKDAVDALGLPEQLRDNRLYELTNNHMTRISGSSRRSSGWGQTSQNLQFGNFFCNDASSDAVAKLGNVPWTNTAEGALHCRLQNAELETNYYTTYFDAELLCSALGIKELKHTWMFELAHEVPLCMTFEKTALICTARPVLKRNAAGELHCDEGPAVAWPDGCGQYYIDGHALGNLGYKIIEKPELLTLDDLNNEPNEEVKRLAIDKFGWGKYLDGIGAKVIDRRENWVDNTIEALVSITQKIDRQGWHGGRWMTQQVDHEERKLILSCRSTARQYFLAVPETTKSCEEGQRWMSSGANSNYLKVMDRPVRLVGAS